MYSKFASDEPRRARCVVCDCEQGVVPSLADWQGADKVKSDFKEREFWDADGAQLPSWPLI
eukprot:2756008-Rhodomonas_salina.2